VVRWCRWTTALLLVALTLAGPLAPRVGAAELPPLMVMITDDGFVPARATIPLDATVVWRNASPVAHAVKSEVDIWDSGEILPDTEYQLVFKTPGTYVYLDPLNPANPKAVVVVGSGGSTYGTVPSHLQAASTASGPSSSSGSGNTLTPIGGTPASSAGLPTGAASQPTGGTVINPGSPSPLGGYGGYSPGSSGQVGQGTRPQSVAPTFGSAATPGANYGAFPVYPGGAGGYPTYPYGGYPNPYGGYPSSPYGANGTNPYGGYPSSPYGAYGANPYGAYGGAGAAGSYPGYGVWGAPSTPGFGSGYYPTGNYPTGGSYYPTGNYPAGGGYVPGGYYPGGGGYYPSGYYPYGAPR